MEELKRYMVKAEKKPTSLKGHWRDRVTSTVGIIKELRGILEKFAAEHPGKVIVDDDFGIGTSVLIKTTPALAEKLSTVEGIESVSDPILGTTITAKRWPSP